VNTDGIEIVHAGERVLSLAATSGEVGIVRSTAPDGRFEWFLEATPNETANEPDDELRTFRVGPFDSLESALHVLSRDGAWALEHPRAVHPDVRAEVWRMVCEASRMLAATEGERWPQLEGKWRRACAISST
jgi:hypothetical protein